MTSLHDEVHHYTESEDTVRSLLTSWGILKSTMTCSWGTQMNSCSIPCPETKSADLFTWKCPACKKFKNIRSDSILSGKKITFKSFILLVFYFSIDLWRTLTLLPSQDCWRVAEDCDECCTVSTWFLSNSAPLWTRMSGKVTTPWWQRATRMTQFLPSDKLVFCLVRLLCIHFRLWQ